MSLKKENWKEEHLAKRHKVNYPWCPLCLARKQGEDNPQQHLVPPQQDESQAGMDYLKKDYQPEEVYSNVISSGTVIEKK